MPSFHIRPLSPADEALFIDFYTSLSDATWEMFHPHPREREYLQTLIQSLPQRPDLALFMAGVHEEGRERMAGTVFFWDWHTQVPWFGICVRDGYQGQRLGDQMTAYAVETARSQGKGGILLTTRKQNLRAQALYLKYGFEIIGVDAHDEHLMILRFN